MPRRRQLSQEALDRAVRSKLAQELGIEASCVVIPVRILPVKAGRDQQNWQIDMAGVQASCQASLERAASTVGKTFDLRGASDPLDETAPHAAYRRSRHASRRH